MTLPTKDDWIDAILWGSFFTMLIWIIWFRQDKTMTIKQQVKRLHKAIDEENISYGEIAELDAIAEQLGIKITQDMTAVDVLIEIEDKLSDLQQN